MMILDLNQVMLANLMVSLGGHTNVDIEENMVRHMVLNTIRAINSKNRREWGELIIAADSHNSWRREQFVYYKANRRKSKQTSELNWGQIFDTMDKIRSELKEYMPYRVIHVDRAEADDVIGVIARHAKAIGEKCMIVSGDKDFNQLHEKFGNRVVQWDPTRKKFIENDDPQEHLFRHILKGDSGDGIPNILNDDNCLVIGQRQKAMTEKKIATIKEQYYADELDTMLKRNFARNQMLIDLDYTPPEIQKEILGSYESQANKEKGKIMGYFMAARLKNLMESIGDF